MKRALVIAVLVLVPFGALVALGFSLLKDPPPPPIVLPDRQLLPGNLDAPKLGAAFRAALAPDASTPAPIAVLPIPERPVLPLPQQAPVEEEAGPPPPPSDPAKAGVEPLIQQCFRDLADRVKEPIRVTVAFDVTPAGGYSGVVVKKASWPDPHLTACITDAFEDAKFEPTGLVMRRQTRTFTFGYPDAGR